MEPTVNYREQRAEEERQWKETLTDFFFKPPKVTNNGACESDHVVNVDPPAGKAGKLSSFLREWLKDFEWLYYENALCYALHSL